MKIYTVHIIDKDREEAGFAPVLLGENIQLADRFFSRLKGLLGRTELPRGEGLWIKPCNSIHCFGMKFPIDVLFLDGIHQIMAVGEHIQPGKYVSHKGAKSVLELPAGTVSEFGLSQGQILEFA